MCNYSNLDSSRVKSFVESCYATNPALTTNDIFMDAEDILDMEMQGISWEEMYEDYDRALKEVFDEFCASTGMTATDIVLWIEWYDNHIQWEINQADNEDDWYDEW